MQILIPILAKVVVRRATPTFTHPRSMHLLILLVKLGTIDRINLVNCVVDVLYSVSICT